MEKDKKSREQWIDIAKVIGLLCIILAHTDPEPPRWLMQFRVFDVVLMVVISGYLSAKSYDGNIKDYYIKRFLRLVLPTWLFIVGYNCFLLLFGVEISLERWIKCFLLTRDGMGYVWVILVYFECALLTPLFHLILSKRDGFKSKINEIIYIYIYAMPH